MNIFRCKVFIADNRPDSTDFVSDFSMQKLIASLFGQANRSLHWLEPEVAHFAFVDDQRKRGFLVLVLLIIIPILLLFAVMNLSTDGVSSDVILGIVGTGTAVWMLLMIRRHASLQSAYRIGVAYTLLMNTILLATGGANGVSYLWFYFYPLVVYFLLGHAEGHFWVGLSWGSALLVAVFNLGLYSYPLAISIRFFISYVLVCVLAYGMEFSRYHYYRQLLTEKLALEAALHQVHTLQDLLPICASCKKIRDDDGYWHQVEIYMRQHVGVEFSHSICPECREKLYPLVRNVKPTMAPLTEQTTR